MSDNKCRLCGNDMVRFVGPTGECVSVRHYPGSLACTTRQLTSANETIKKLAEALREILDMGEPSYFVECYGHGLHDKATAALALVKELT